MLAESADKRNQARGRITRRPAEASTLVRVLDDDRDVRESLARLIGSVGLAVEAFATVDEFLEGYDPGRPGCVVLDMRLPGRSGLELAEEFADADFQPTLLMITAYGDVPSAVRAMKAGVFDFIEKPFNDQHFLERVQAAIVADTNRRETAENRRQVLGAINTLSNRERAVMDLVVDGFSNKQVAHRLGIAQKTAENYRAAVMEKMGAESLPELVQMILLARSPGTPGPE